MSLIYCTLIIKLWFATLVINLWLNPRLNQCYFKGNLKKASSGFGFDYTLKMELPFLLNMVINWLFGTEIASQDILIVFMIIFKVWTHVSWVTQHTVHDGALKEETVCHPDVNPLTRLFNLLVLLTIFHDDH